MTFNGIVDGDDVLAPELMENFRHRRMGDNIVPVDEDGNDADGTYSAGESGCEFSNVFTNKVEVSDQTHLVLTGAGNLTIDESVSGGYYEFNTSPNSQFFNTAQIQRGGFAAYTPGDEIVMLEAGLYRIDLTLALDSNNSAETWDASIFAPHTTAVSSTSHDTVTQNNHVYLWAEVVLAVNDKVRVRLNKLNTPDGTLYGGVDGSKISIRKIGAA